MGANRRRFLQSVTTTAAGLVLLGERRASGEKPRGIRIQNDTDSHVTIELFDPAASLESPYEDTNWSVEPGVEDDLGIDVQPLNVMSDWGIRALSADGTESVVMRLREVGFPETIKVSEIFSRPVAEYPQGTVIESTAGWEIDRRFGNTERDILHDALALFYERFLQPYGNACPEICTRAGFSLEDAFPVGDFTDANGNEIDARDIIEEQRRRLTHNYVALKLPFPKVSVGYAYEPESTRVAQAPIGIVQTRPRGIDDPDGAFPVDGQFLILINDHFVARTSEHEHFGHPAYWAGVLAHEALHNLGHKHPSPTDEEYHRYQMILVERMVMNNAKVRYGEKTETPVLCGPWSA